MSAVTGGGPGSATGVAVSGLQVLSQGGAGSGANGGAGGRFSVNGSTGSDLRLLPSGSVNSIVNPVVVKPDLGTNPRTVSTNQTWTVDTGLGGVLTSGSSNIQGDFPGNATGLWIQPGVTLTIHPNFGTGSLRLNFSGGIYIQGTLRVGYRDVTLTGDQLSDDAADFNLTVDGNLVIASTGVVDASGRDDSAGTDLDAIGGNGGYFQVTGNTSTVINAGRIDTTGGSGDQGGNGGSVSLTANNYGLFNRGTIETSGGAGTGLPAIPRPAIANIALPTPTPVEINYVYYRNAGVLGTAYYLESIAPAWMNFPFTGTNVTVAGCFDASKNGNYAINYWYADYLLNLDNFTSSFSYEFGSPGQIGSSTGTQDYTLNSAAPAWIFAGGSVTITGAADPLNNGTFTVSAVSGQRVTLAKGTGRVDANSAARFVEPPGTLSTAGGSAGSIDLTSNDSGSNPGGLFNTGFLTSRGGDGTGGGGDGGSISLYAGNAGALTSSDALNSSGGNSTSDGAGGRGGSVSINSSGSLRVTGTIRALGGTGALSGDGGSGGNVNLNSFASGSITDQSVLSGIAVGAGIHTSGGSGVTGGNAGSVDIQAQASGSITPGQDIVWIVGYAGINTSGGNGQTDGGIAGDITIANNSLSSSSQRYQGSIRNEVPMVARGGGGTTGNGGAGGLVDISTQSGNTNNNRSVVNIAPIDLRGGDGDTAGGLGGSLSFYDTFKVENTGALDASGGAAGLGTGGDGGGLSLLSDTTVSNTAKLTANGGASLNDNGGTGGGIFVQARISSTVGNLSADGANGGTNALVVGGWGGTVEVSSSEATSVVHGTLSTRAGTGEPVVGTGTVGEVRIDGINVGLTAGAITFP